MKLGLRRRLMLLVTLGATATLVVLTIGFNVALRSSLDTDADRLLEARAQTALGGLKVEHGRVRVAQIPDAEGPDAQSWVFVGGTAVESPAAPASLDRLARSLADGTRTTAEDAATDTRLFAVPIVEDGRRLGTVVSGLSVEPYERTAKKALLGSAIFSLVVLALILVAARVVTSRALRPVARMTAEAADWSEHDLDHRFNAGEPYDELTSLAATFDSMLDRVASALRHEQRFSAELSHELRTPLAAIVTEAELALRRERSAGEYRTALEGISRRSAQLRGVLETLLLAAREEASSEPASADAGAAAELVVGQFSALAAERGIALTTVAPADPVAVGVAGPTVERILAPVVENACRYAASRARVTVGHDGGTVSFVVTDDGPGIDESERDRIFEPGYRGAAASAEANPDGSGLGLSLARRLARAVEGDVTALEADHGAQFEVRLPRSRTR